MEAESISHKLAIQILCKCELDRIGYLFSTWHFYSLSVSYIGHLLRTWHYYKLVVVLIDFLPSQFMLQEVNTSIKIVHE